MGDRTPSEFANQIAMKGDLTGSRTVKKLTFLSVTDKADRSRRARFTESLARHWDAGQGRANRGRWFSNLQRMGCYWPALSQFRESRKRPEVSRATPLSMTPSADISRHQNKERASRYHDSCSGRTALDREHSRYSAASKNIVWKHHCAPLFAFPVAFIYKTLRVPTRIIFSARSTL